MSFKDRWADYARVQATARLSTSITQSDANDVRLDRIIDGITVGTAEEPAGIERAVKSHARRERNRQRARNMTRHAFMPVGTPNPEQTLIWKQAWTHFGEAFSGRALRLLIQSETTTASTPMTGIDRTRLSRIRSSAAYKAVHADTFM